MMDDLPLAFNVERIRQEMLHGLIIPREIVNEAFAELSAQLKAKTTKFFSYKGRVISSKDIADNGARLTAIDQTMSLAGLYKPDDRRSGGNGIPSFAIEVTPQGVIRIAVGQHIQEALPAPIQDRNILESVPAAIPSLINEAKNKYNTILDELVNE